jgi:hypothetical protein
MKKANTQHNNNLLSFAMLSVIMLSVTFYLIRDITKYWTVMKKANTQHNNTANMLSVAMLSVTFYLIHDFTE